MNNEIKEILLYLKNNTFIPDETKRKYKILHRDKVRKLLDYITNLQQENERLKEELFKSVNNTNNSMELTEDYKSRCEKASDKLGNYKHYSTPTEEQNSENEDIVDSALNILQNGDEK